MSSATALTLATAVWFGPALATFEARIPGNPYDFEENDVRVSFVSGEGHKEERLAYFADGKWNARLTARHAGEYEARLIRNGEPVDTAPVSVSISEDDRLAEGFVRVDGTRFVTDAGTPYFPLGHNLGWRQNDHMALTDQLARMGAAGVTWTRVWSCHWDGRNPFMVRVVFDPPLRSEGPPMGELLPASLENWESAIRAAESANIRLQLVLFHHGLFTTANDSNWSEHPWNAVNGGFLETPQEFFTDETAREYTKRWLRYAVARWGHSPSIMAWELFNEVQWVDLARQDGGWNTIATWHAEMAAFLRGIDPYHHLVTSSSDTHEPGYYDALDFFQPHVYSTNVTNAIAGPEPLPGKPWFYGEFGGTTSGPPSENERFILRDGIWAGILAGHAGAAAYWYWDWVEEFDLDDEFTKTAQILDASKFAGRSGLKSFTPKIEGSGRGPLEVSPAKGWGETTRYRFDLPGDNTPALMAELSSFINGSSGGNAHFTKEPIVFSFDAPSAGEATIRFRDSGPQGAEINVFVNDVLRSSATYAPWERRPDFRPKKPEPITVEYAAGRNEISITSPGSDWFRISSITFDGLGNGASGAGIGGDTFAMLRLTKVGDSVPEHVDTTFGNLKDGDYEAVLFDLETGGEKTASVTARDGWVRGLPVPFADAVVVIGD